jgi:hypothetical protein
MLFEVAAEEPLSEYVAEHRPANRALGNFMELAPQASSADQKPFIGGNIRPWNAEHALFAAAIAARVNYLGGCGASGFDQAQGRFHPYGFGWILRIIGRSLPD